MREVAEVCLQPKPLCPAGPAPSLPGYPPLALAEGSWEEHPQSQTPWGGLYLDIKSNDTSPQPSLPRLPNAVKSPGREGAGLYLGLAFPGKHPVLKWKFF